MTDIDIGSHLFIDVEASGLGPTSYPIEIGWADLDGRTGSVLIRPAASWTYWDEEAELLHCISRAELAEKGLTASAASRLVAETFAGRILVSDSPGWDGHWLAMLFGETTLPVPVLTHLQDLADRISAGPGGSHLSWAVAKERADDIAPPLHRAAPDALNMATAIRLLIEPAS